MSLHKEIVERLDTIIRDCEVLGITQTTLNELEVTKFDIQRQDLSELPELNEVEQFLIDKGYQILAIKAFRERTGASLYKAKKRVDNYRGR